MRKHLEMSHERTRRTIEFLLEGAEDEVMKSMVAHIGKEPAWETKAHDVAQAELQRLYDQPETMAVILQIAWMRAAGLIEYDGFFRYHGGTEWDPIPSWELTRVLASQEKRPNARVGRRRHDFV